MHSFLNVVPFFMCCISTLLFLIGCLGYSSSSSTIQDVAWIVVDQGRSTMYYGLKAVSHNKESILYDECAEAANVCDTCADKGKVAFGLLIIATLSTVLTAIFSGLLERSSHQLSTCYSTNPKMRTICIIAAVTSVGTSLGALVAFMGDCYNAIDDVTDENLVWGPGSALSLAGLLMMTSVALMQIITGCI